MCWMLQQYAQRVGNLSILNILLGAAHIPSPSAVSAMLSEEEQMCYKCNIPIAASSLRRAKNGDYVRTIGAPRRENVPTFANRDVVDEKVKNYCMIH